MSNLNKTAPFCDSDLTTSLTMRFGVMLRTLPLLTRYTRPSGRRRDASLSMKYVHVLHLFEAISLHSTVLIHSR